MSDPNIISVNGYRAGIFDLDGVVTDTASAHFGAWKRLFDEFLQRFPDQAEFTLDDYRNHVDGKPRIEGITSFLDARGIELPRSDGEDGPTIHTLADRKNEFFHQHLREEGVDVFDDAVSFIRSLRDHGISTAVVSSSKNCERVLKSAGLDDLFAERVDGNDLNGLRGKPEPDMFVEAVRRLGVEPSDAFMAEDAIAGVEAGRAGDFGLVIGIARDGGGDALQEHGADVVIGDFAQLRIR
jgi:beta-phosphoglucomutase family hydrolase